MKREQDKVAKEILRRLTHDLRERGDLEKVRLLPASSADVPDEMDARLVVRAPATSHSKEPDSAALAAAKGILESMASSSQAGTARSGPEGRLRYLANVRDGQIRQRLGQAARHSP